MSMDKQQGQLGRERSRGNLDPLTRDAMAAEAAGMSYGKYKSLHPRTQAAPVPTRAEKKTEDTRKYRLTCFVCGAEYFASRVNQKYCCEYCRNQAKNSAYRARNQKQIIQEVAANG